MMRPNVALARRLVGKEGVDRDEMGAQGGGSREQSDCIIDMCEIIQYQTMEIHVKN